MSPEADSLASTEIDSLCEYLTVVFLIKDYNYYSINLKSISKSERKILFREDFLLIFGPSRENLHTPMKEDLSSINRAPNSKYKVLNFITVTLILIKLRTVIFQI